MIVRREMGVSTNIAGFKIGDKIFVEPQGYGMFKATLQNFDQEDKNIGIFMFDCCVDYCYNRNDCDRTLELVHKEFPEELKPRLKSVDLPTVGMIFGHDSSEYKRWAEPDNDSRFLLMRDRHNRIVVDNIDADDSPMCYWLKNREKRVEETYSYAVNYLGNLESIYYRPANATIGIRPVFSMDISNL